MSKIFLKNLKPGFFFGQTISIEILKITKPRSLTSRKDQKEFSIVELLVFDGSTHMEASTYDLSISDKISEGKIYVSGFEVVSKIVRNVSSLTLKFNNSTKFLINEQEIPKSSITCTLIKNCNVTTQNINICGRVIDVSPSTSGQKLKKRITIHDETGIITVNFWVEDEALISEDDFVILENIRCSIFKNCLFGEVNELSNTRVNPFVPTLSKRFNLIRATKLDSLVNMTASNVSPSDSNTSSTPSTRKRKFITPLDSSSDGQTSPDETKKKKMDERKKKRQLRL